MHLHGIALPSNKHTQGGGTFQGLGDQGSRLGMSLPPHSLPPSLPPWLPFYHNTALPPSHHTPLQRRLPPALAQQQQQQQQQLFAASLYPLSWDSYPLASPTGMPPVLTSGTSPMQSAGSAPPPFDFTPKSQPTLRSARSQSCAQLQMLDSKQQCHPYKRCRSDAGPLCGAAFPLQPSEAAAAAAASVEMPMRSGHSGGGEGTGGMFLS